MSIGHYPRSHTLLADCYEGAEYGHVPGHQYHDVHAVISRARNGRFRCQVVEVWGSAQGYDEEHGRTTVVGRGSGLAEAIGAARERAAEADIHRGYLAQALSMAEDEAEEALAAEVGADDAE